MMVVHISSDLLVCCFRYLRCALLSFVFLCLLVFIPLGVIYGVLGVYAIFCRSILCDNLGLVTLQPSYLWGYNWFHDCIYPLALAALDGFMQCDLPYLVGESEGMTIYYY